ncbi:PH domain-containing protein [Mycena indigotica]|uniref:PH domain-containing protein n=1 Tax=Mycena indigotica TaxID=2126181 RepID=A0A8H6SWK6_9AGAR|nr:PH domain-containing protein [Mycena indigotica]KAF7306694.1 PH domain-containing protein [Mycena indigotica]
MASVGTLRTLVAATVPTAGVVIREGWILKKRRKKMQGFARRYFTLYQNGVLAYSFNQAQPIRDQLSLHDSAISTAPGQRDIHIDSNAGTFHLKCLTPADFDLWMSSLRRFIGTGPESRRSMSMRHLTRHGSVNVNKSGVVLEEMAKTLSELEEALSALPREGASHLKPPKAKVEKEKAKGDKAVFGLFKRTSHHAALNDVENNPPELSEKTTSTQQLQDILQTLKAQHGSLVKSIQSLAITDVVGQSLRGSPLPITAEEPENIPRISDSPVPSFSAPISRKRTSVLTTTTSESVNEWFDFDAESHDGAEEFVLDVTAQPSKIGANDSTSSLGHSSVDTDIIGEPEKVSTEQPEPSHVVHRTHLPSPSIGDEGSLFSVLKKNVGKDLSTITFPVSFNEPLTLLQRAAEEVEYYDLLNLAAAATDPVDRICYVAAFAVSGYAHTRHRSGRKGFNPMLGETFEDHRMKFIAEKVRHHPLEMAYHAEGPGWALQATSTGKTKFWGKSLEIIPLGNTYLTIGDDRYTWNKPSSFMRNLMVGTKYFEHVGKMTIENVVASVPTRCVVEFKPSGYFGASNQISGVVQCGQATAKLEGKWDDSVSQTLDDSHFRILWRATPPIIDHEAYYGFTSFGITLNEITSDMEGKLPPTDSRYRPDVRALEEGHVDLAEREKTRVEELQRSRRKSGKEVSPRWFKQVNGEWEYTGGYWESRTNGWKDSVDLW